MRHPIRWLVLLALNLAVALLVLRNAPSHAPVQTGTAAEFWMYACGIDIDGSAKSSDYFGGFYPPQGPWAIYSIQGYHEQFLYRVPLTEVARHLPTIDRQLRDPSFASRSEWLSDVAEQWQRTESDKADVVHLLDAMWKAYLTPRGEDAEELREYRLDDERFFQERWRRANRYWLTVAFEIAWLSLVLYVAAWPWLFGRGRIAKAAHLGFAFPLLFVPYFFGYVPYACTSAFPAGGVFYPYLIVRFRNLPDFPWDSWLLAHFPQPFEPLTQDGGPWLAITGMGMIDPTTIALLALLISLSTYTLLTLRSKFLSSAKHSH